MISRKQTKWVVKTLSSLMKDAQVTKLDILKIDIEGHEWASLLTAIKDGAVSSVRQLVVEVHMWDVNWSSGLRARAFGRRVFIGTNFMRRDPSLLLTEDTLETFQRVLDALTGAGFRLFHSHKNPMSALLNFGPTYPKAACCYELSFIRV